MYRNHARVRLPCWTGHHPGGQHRHYSGLSVSARDILVHLPLLVWAGLHGFPNVYLRGYVMEQYFLDYGLASAEIEVRGVKGAVVCKMFLV